MRFLGFRAVRHVNIGVQIAQCSASLQTFASHVGTNYLTTWSHRGYGLGFAVSGLGFGIVCELTER